MFSLKLFGGAIVEGPDGQVRGRLVQKRRLALLAILAFGRGRPVSRDKLLGLLWPETDEERGRHSLADAVYHVRKALHDDAVISTGDDLLLNSEIITSDVQQFEDALARGDLEAAAALYAGPLLDGFHVDDASELERWCERERDRLARAHAVALEQLAEAAGARGDEKAAVHWWRLLSAADPYNARVVLRLMEALDRTGDRAAAIQQGRVHAALMQDDVGAAADAAVLAFIDELKSPRGSKLEPVRREPVPPQPDVARDDVARQPPPAGPQRRRVMLAAALLVLVGISALAALSLRGRGPRTAAARNAADAQAIAVLPCANLSRDASDEYFSDGLTEELIAALSQVQALRVVARTSVFAYKDHARDIREVGKALNVGTVLECSVRRVQDRVRVTAQLITAADGFHLWAQSYEREGTDIFAIQSDLAMRIVDALETRLTESERGRLARRPTSDQAAYALYLKGQYFWRQRTTASYERAVNYFQQAIALDSQYARAYGGLARTYSLQGLSGVFTPVQAGERMRQAALKAIELDPSLAEAYAAMGVYYNLYEWDAEKAERSFLRAIQLDPGYSDVRHYYANMLRCMGRSAEALRQREKAVEADPLSAPLNVGLGVELIRLGRTQQGVRALRDALEFDPAHWHAWIALGDYYASIKRFDAAIDAHRRAVASGGREAEPALARVLALAGRTDEARAMLAGFEAEAQRTGNYAVRVAPVFVALNDVPGALNWLEHAYEYKHPQLRLLPLFAPSLSGDARFAAFIRRIGLVP